MRSPFLAKGIMKLKLLVMVLVAVFANQKKPIFEDKDNDGFPDTQMNLLGGGQMNPDMQKTIQQEISATEAKLREQYRSPRSTFKKNFQCSACRYFSARITGVLSAMRRRKKIEATETEFVTLADAVCDSKDMADLGISPWNEFDQFIGPEVPVMFIETTRGNSLTGSWIMKGLRSVCDRVTEYADRVNQQHNTDTLNTTH